MNLSNFNGFPREVEQSRSTVKNGNTGIHVVTRELAVPADMQRAEPMLVVNLNGYNEHKRNWNVLNAGLFRLAKQNGQPLISISYSDPRGANYAQGDLTSNAVAVTQDATERFRMPARQVAHSNGGRAAVEGGKQLTDNEAVSSMLLLTPAGFGDGKQQNVPHMAAVSGIDAIRGIRQAAASDGETRFRTALYVADTIASSAAHMISAPGRNLDQIYTTVAQDMSEKVAAQHFNYGNVEVVKGLRDVVCPPQNIDAGLDAYDVPQDIRYDLDSTHTSFFLAPESVQPVYDLVMLHSVEFASMDEEAMIAS